MSPSDIERIELLNPQSPLSDLQSRAKKIKKFAIISRVPTPDNTYYPIPYYAALFKGKWYNIKQLIGIAKEAKLKNSAPIKYHIEIANSFWNNIFKVEGITDGREDLRPNGFTRESMFHDFPIRGHEVLLHVRCRRWLDEDGHNVMTECNFIQESTRCSTELAAF